MDYAVWRAGQLGIYLLPPFVDELGYYHGGKRHWVNFRRPGSVSLDYNVKSANSQAQRSAENYFYTDQQINWDFEKYVQDWLNHVNPRTGVAFKNDPALSIVQVGNELWTAAQDAPGWVAGKAAFIKKISPSTLIMDSGTDGLAVQNMAWASPYIDILETHPYSVYGANEVSSFASFAAAKGKAFAVGEYAWSKQNSPAIEAAVRSSPNVFTSALWSLQNDSDLHNNGAMYGGDDVSFYVPGKDSTQVEAVARIKAHHQALASLSPRPSVQAQDDYIGANGDAWKSSLWALNYISGLGSATILDNRGRLHLGSLGNYDGSNFIIASSKAPGMANSTVTFTLSQPGPGRESYLRVPLRSTSPGEMLARYTCYFIQFGINADGSAYVTPGKMVKGVEAFLRSSGIALPSWSSTRSVGVSWSAEGPALKIKLNGTEVWSGSDSSLASPGITGFELRGGRDAVATDLFIDDWRIVV